MLGTDESTSVFDYVPPLSPFQCCLNQMPSDHLNIELAGGRGEGDQKVLDVCFRLDILGNITENPNLFWPGLYLSLAKLFRLHGLRNNYQSYAVANIFVFSSLRTQACYSAARASEPDLLKTK